MNPPANEVKIPVSSRQSFIDILVNYGDLPQTQSNYTYYIVLLEAGKLEDRLKPILSEVTFGELQRQIGRAKQMEVILRKSGQWPVFIVTGFWRRHDVAAVPPSSAIFG